MTTTTDCHQASQKELLLEHLKLHGTITKLESLRLYGIMNTGGRMHELQHDGHPVLSRMVDIGGKRVAEYYLVNFDTNGQAKLW